MAHNPPPLPPVAPSWLARNWKWLVAGVLALGLCFLGFIALIIFSVFGIMKKSDVYQQAIQRAREHPGILQELGSPIEDGWFFSGNINTSNSSGNANLTIPLSGPQGEGTLDVVATREESQWHFDQLVFEQASPKGKIDLLGGDKKETLPEKQE